MRLVNWFNSELKNTDLTWAQAKDSIIKKFKAENREPHAEEKLAAMVARVDEHPIHFAQDFHGIMSHHGVQDSKVYGNFLLGALSRHHLDYVDTVRGTYIMRQASATSTIIKYMI